MSRSIHKRLEDIESQLKEGSKPVLLEGSNAIEFRKHGGRTCILNGKGTSHTLPPAKGSGAKYTFIVGVKSKHLFKLSGKDTLCGGLVNDVSEGMKRWGVPQGTSKIALNGTTSGGAVGDRIEFIDVEAGKWLISGLITSTGEAVTPFKA